MEHQSYVSRKPSLMRTFRKSIARIKPTLVARHGEERAAALRKEAQLEYETLIPQIPYLGPRNPFLILLLPTTRYLAVYQTLTRAGWTAEEAGKAIMEMAAEDARAIPVFVRRIIGRLWFSPFLVGRVRRRALISQQREYPGGFVYNFVEGDGKDFDWGIDYIECANCKLLTAQNAMGMAPYLCATDEISSQMLGWGLRRTTTLAEGSQQCDFRFKKGGETLLALPRTLHPLP